MNRAIIDIGTNTTHLLIGDVESHTLLEVIHKRRFYTFLGEGGLSTIANEAIERLLAALDQFQNDLNEYQCDSIHVLATEGLRAASNGTVIERRIKSRYGWPLTIIDGNEEASLIFDGVRQAVAFDRGDYLIMDVGGGSVEFIGVCKGKKHFQSSISIGISRLYNQFHKSDPITKKQISKMNKYLAEQLVSVWDQTKDYVDMQLIGCAGTFEIFLKNQELDSRELTHKQIKKDMLDKLYESVIGLPIDDRHLVPDLPKERSQYIVVALSLVRWVTDTIGCENFIVSKYAMKEGAIVSEIYF